MINYYFFNSLKKTDWVVDRTIPSCRVRPPEVNGLDRLRPAHVNRAGPWTVRI
jgi:hypothetical protein